MSPHEEVALTAGRELRRTLAGAKGIIVSALFLLGGVITSLIQLAIQKHLAAANESLQGDAASSARMMLYKGIYGDTDIVSYLVACPDILFGLFQGTLMFLPVLILMLGFDQTVGELQHRTLRYVVGRADRGSVVLGKALAQWGIVALMNVLLYVVVIAITLAQGGASAAALASWGARFWLFNTAYAGAYVGLVALLSALVRTPSVALFGGFGVIVAMSVAHVAFGNIDVMAPARWAFPVEYQHLLVSPSPARALAGIALLVTWGGVFVFAASEALNRRDV